MTEPVAIKEKSKKINIINKETIHRICSGQVVLDLAAAVKELVENSLDSGATVIDIKLTDYGMTCITITDNGKGVLEQDFEGLGLKHHTSKLKEFSDLTEVNTFGFRGEALSSLCSLSDLSIITKHSTSEHGFKLEFEHSGILRKKEACARERGTTVHVKNIFKTLPVRAKEFRRNIKKEYTRTIQLLYGYCIISTDTKITCSNIISGKSSNLAINTASSNSILHNISAIFGKKSLDRLVELPLISPDEATLQEYSLPTNAAIDFAWDCYISNCTNNVGRSTNDRQFFYINGRPCELTKISKLINHVYHKYNNKQYPFIFLNLKINKQSADINVTPDKRTIFFTQERLMLATVKFSLISKYNKLQGSLIAKPLNELNFASKRAISPNYEDPPAKRLQSLRLLSNETKEKPTSSVTYDNNIQNTAKTKNMYTVNMQISILTIKQKLQDKQNISMNRNVINTRIKYKAQIDVKENSKAEDELKKELTKESFLKMEIIGQFNVGFIIGRLEDDLFIIDQHATDEKFQFEKLNDEIQLKTQKLLFEKSLNLSSIDETILIEHQQVFNGNGFTFKINDEDNPGHRVKLTGIPVIGGWKFGPEDIEELIFLIKEDDTENKEKMKMLRPSRLRQMLASRACRSAVMIGTVLNYGDMKKLIVQMSQMENPWNCPHGRPTIRHLLSLVFVHK